MQVDELKSAMAELCTIKMKASTGGAEGETRVTTACPEGRLGSVGSVG